MPQSVVNYSPKDIQVDFESGMLFNMGQLLSIPFIIIGVYCMLKATRKRQ